MHEYLNFAYKKSLFASIIKIMKILRAHQIIKVIDYEQIFKI